MPGWGDILAELGNTPRPDGTPDFDRVRRKYLLALSQLTGRPTIIYYSDFLTPGKPQSGIDLGDVTGLMQTCQGVSGPSLDLLIHSPGGTAEAAASMVSYLRSKFDDVRAIVPLAAMSAATILATSANQIIMGKHSQLGPIDPQFIIRGTASPARGILDQFDRAKKEIKADINVLGAWSPMLSQYGPALLEQCEKAEKLSQALVAQWLGKYMLVGQPNAGQRARRIARWLGSYRIHQSHGMPIHRDSLKAKGVTVIDLEADQNLQDAVLSVHHATLHTFSGTRAFKIVENHLGRAYIQS